MDNRRFRRYSDIAPVEVIRVDTASRCDACDRLIYDHETSVRIQIRSLRNNHKPEICEDCKDALIEALTKV